MTENTIEFTQPHWLWLLPLIVSISFLLYRNRQYVEVIGLASATVNNKDIFLHPLIHLISNQITKTRLPIYRWLIYLAIFTCLVIALAEPVYIGEKLPEPPQERDIIFIIDTSVSMILRDYILDNQRIDRMTLLKGFLDLFVKKLEGERIGIIVFGSDAYTMVPLTQDQTLLRRMISRLTATMVGRYKALGEGVALAVKQAQSQAARHQVLILLTDAGQATGKILPSTAAMLTKGANLPLYTIAIGATDQKAREDTNSGLLYQPANIELLTTMANYTGAKSYQAGNAQTLELAVNDISQRETNLRDTPPQYYRDTLYFWPLLLGLLILNILQIYTFVSNRPA